MYTYKTNDYMYMVVYHVFMYTWLTEDKHVDYDRIIYNINYYIIIQCSDTETD